MQQVYQSATMSPSKKRQTSVRLSNAALESLQALSADYGLPQTGMLELLLRIYQRDPEPLRDPYMTRIVTRRREASSPMPARPFRFSSGAYTALQDLTTLLGHDSTAWVIELMILHQSTGDLTTT